MGTLSETVLKRCIGLELVIAATNLWPVIVCHGSYSRIIADSGSEMVRWSLAFTLADSQTEIGRFGEFALHWCFATTGPLLHSFTERALLHKFAM